MSALLLSLSVCLYLTQAIDIYVDVNNGNDINSGLSKSDALSSLKAAQKLVRLIKNEQHQKPITVNILPGVYFESLYFTPLDSGSYDAPIIWQGIGDGVRVSNGIQIDVSSLTDCKSPLAKNNYPLKCANLKSLNIDVGNLQATSGLMSCDNNKTELFYDDAPQILARYPNINQENQMYVYTNVDSMKDTKTIIWKDTDQNNNAGMWSKESDGWLHGYWKFDWADLYVPVSSVTSAGNSEYYIASQSFESGGSYLTPNNGARFYLTNFLSELDTMGEYYIDRDQQMLYWYPPTTNLENNIFLSNGQYGNYIKDGASNLQFNNLTFEYSKITGIYGRNLNNITITNCKVYNSGNNGIDVEGYNIKIESNDVSYMGCVGIHCAGGDYYTLTPGNNIVNHNHIYNFARWKRTYLPGLFFGGVGNDYSYNNITFGPHNGIDGGGNEAQGCNNKFTYNLLQNTTFETSDSGSFYTCGQEGQAWINRGNQFTHNTVKNIRNLVPLANGQDVTLNGIYLDDQMSGWNVSYNTFINIDRGVFVGGGRSNMVYNNYCDKVDYCLHLDNRGMNWEASSCAYPNGENWKGLYSVNYTQPPWSTAYPALSTITANNTCIPIYNQFVNNEWCDGKGLADFKTSDAESWGDTLKNNTNTCH